MENIKCIFCEKENNRVAIEENGYMGRKCSQCGLIYISPRPSFDEIVTLYEHDGVHISAESHISAEFSKRLYARHNLKIVTSFVKSGTLLEIGAGAGYFLDEARKIGFNPYGIELNPIQANYIRAKLEIPCEESPLTTSVFEGKKFDVVYHCDVISHFFDPISEFRKINERMKKGSFLVFETGNLGEVNQKYFKHFQRFQYPDHLFFFSADNLRDLLEKTGFEFLKIYRYSILPELMVIKAFAKTKDLALKFNKRGRYSNNSSREKNLTGDVLQSPHKNSNAKKVMRIGWNYFNYIVRYKIGYIIPKTHMPQTIVVVARKKK